MGSGASLKKVANGIGSGIEWEVRFGREESWNAQNGCGYYEHHGGTISFARAKDALKAEGGEAATQAPQSREEEGEEMAVSSKQGDQELRDEPSA